MTSMQRTFFWIICGALMGFGLIAFGLGLLPFLLGAVLALYGVKRIGPEGFWITIVSMGITPALILAYDYLSADPATTWFPDNYLYGIVLFVALALGGVVWGLLEARRTSNPRP
jgi:hypothetical protein